MRNLFVLTIVIVATIVGLVIYTEMNHRKFIKELPQVPINKSARQQNLTSSELGSQGQNMERAAEGFRDSEDQTPGLQTKVPDTEPPTPQDNTAIPLNQESASLQATAPDWRDDDAFPQASSRDPWYQEDMSMKFVDWNKLSQEEQLSIAHKSLIKKFGDISQVRTVIAFDNRPRDLPIPIDEFIAHTEACLYLWPDETTRQSLAQLKQLKASGFKEFLGTR